MLNGGTPTAGRQAIVHHSVSGHFAIRQGKWKLCLARGSGGWTSPTEKEAAKLDLPSVQLYDMTADVGEQRNLYAEQTQTTQQLLELLQSYVQRGRSNPGSRLRNDAKINLWKSK